MKPIKNKEDKLIKEYLNIRNKLISEFEKSTKDSDFKDIWLSEVEKTGNVDSLLYNYDNESMESKLSEKAKSLVTGYDTVVEIVEHDFIIHEHRYGTLSFKTKEERHQWLKNKSEECDYDAFNDFDCLDIKEIKGSLEDNYDDFIDKYENGEEIYVKADSIYSNNIKVAIL